MSFVKNVLSFENFNLGHMWDKIKDNPARVLYGGIDPASTKLWNKVLNRDDKPLVDQMGGASPDTYTAAREAGVPTSDGKTMHDIAHVIAAAYAGGYGAQSAGLGGAAGAGGVGGGGGEAIGMGSIGASAGTYTPATIESAVGTTGYGASSAGAGGGAGTLAPAAGGAFNWQSLLRNNPFGGGGQPQSAGSNANDKLLQQRRELEQALWLADQRKSPWTT